MFKCLFWYRVTYFVCCVVAKNRFFAEATYTERWFSWIITEGLSLIKLNSAAVRLGITLAKLPVIVKPHHCWCLVMILTTNIEYWFSLQFSTLFRALFDLSRFEHNGFITECPTFFNFKWIEALTIELVFKSEFETVLRQWINFVC